MGRELNEPGATAGSRREDADPSACGPDGRPRQDVLKRLTNALIEAVSPERIVLYGSGARGEMTADSDIDLLVVVENGKERELEERADASVRNERCSVQVLITTEAELGARAHKPYDVLYAALDEGVSLHDTRPAGERIAGPRRDAIGADERHRDAAEWLEAAAGRLSLTENPTRLRDTVCEESSRTVRFGLKAAAIAAGGCHHSQRSIAALRLEAARLGIDPCIDAALAAELDGYKECYCLDREIEVATCERLALAAHCVVARAAAVIGVKSDAWETLMHGPDAARQAIIEAAGETAAGPAACE